MKHNRTAVQVNAQLKHNCSIKARLVLKHQAVEFSKILHYKAIQRMLQHLNHALWADPEAASDPPAPLSLSLFPNQQHSSYRPRSQRGLSPFCSPRPVLPAQRLLCFQTPVPSKRAARSRGREASPDVDPEDQQHTLSEGTGRQN